MSKKRMRSVPVQPEADRTAKARGVVWRQSAEEAALAKKEASVVCVTRG